MAESAPLLSPTNSGESVIPAGEKQLSSLDDMIEQWVGTFGWAQLLQAFLVSFAWFFDAQQTFISIFTDTEPTWHCTQLTGEPCNSVSNICNLPQDSWAWDEPQSSSIISEWTLECSGSILTGLPASSFFLGCLLSGLVLATLADTWLGRKNMLFLSCLTMSISSILTAFSPNIYIYSLLRFASGFGRGAIGACALVLSSELVGKRWRGQVGIIGFFCFGLGFISLPAIAYINRRSTWRNIYLFTSIPAIIYCILVHTFVCESPRWLFIKGRKEEAVSTLRSIAPISPTCETLSLSAVDSIDCEETWNVDLYSAVKKLLQRRWAIRRLSAVMVIGFGTGMVYYGMPLGVGNLAFNLYLSVTLNALAELPSALMTFLLIGRLNRRSSLLFFTIISGLCSIMCVVLGHDGRPGLQIGLELVSFFSACTALNVLLIYTLELFPTCVRNSAMSMVRQAVVFGSVFSPDLVAASRKNGFFSYGLFGLVIGSCGVFVAWLPETRGGSLCDTMDQLDRKEVVRGDGGSDGHTSM